MIGHIIRKEILSNIASLPYLVAIILCSGLILLSFYTGLSSYIDQVAEYKLTQSLNRQDLARQTSYLDLGIKGIRVSKPPETLSVIVTGLENRLGGRVLVNRTSEPVPQGSRIEDNPIFAVFGELDLMIVFKSILTLLAIILSFNAICGEKEDGTLRLMLAYPVPKDTLILGKMIGGGICLVIPLIISLILGTTIMMFFSNIDFTVEEWIRISLIFVIFLLYILLFYACGMFVSVLTSRSRNSLLILLFIYVACTVIIPKGSVIIASQFVEVLPLQELAAQKDQIRQDAFLIYEAELQSFRRKHISPSPPHMDEDTPKEVAEAKRASFLQAYRRWSSEVYMPWFAEFEQKWKETLEKNLERVEQNYRNRQNQLVTLAMTLSRFSPVSAMTYASMSLANTGIARQEQFFESVSTYRDAFGKYAKQKHEENGGVISLSSGPDGLPTWSGKQGEKPIDISSLPTFQYKREPLSQSIDRVLVDILLLALLTLVFFTGSYFSFLKYDVR